MWKLGSNWDTRNTSDNRGETPVKGGRWSRRKWGKEGESMKESLPLTLCTYVRIPMSISISCMGWGVGREPGESPPSAVCMYVTITMNYIMM